MRFPVVAVTLVAALSLAAHEPRKRAVPGGVPSDPRAVVATVGSHTITEADLLASMPADVRTRLQTAIQTAADTELEVAQEHLADRLVEQEAARRGMTAAALVQEELAKMRQSHGGGGTLLPLRTNIHDSKRAFLAGAVDRALLELEAKERGVSVQALLDAEVGAKAAVPQSEVEAIVEYELAKQRTVRARDDVRKQVEETLRARAIERRHGAFLGALRAQHEIRTFLEPPRTTVSADGDRVRGRRDAPVQVVVFSDFQCPFCAKVGPLLTRVQSLYGDRVAIAFRDFPLPSHERAIGAAEAANCAAKQGKFWEYHDALFANQGDLAPEGLGRRASEVGLDAAAFQACLASGEMRAEIAEDVADGEAIGVAGTPALFVNGRFFGGTPTLDDMRAVIDEELQQRVGNVAGSR